MPSRSSGVTESWSRFRTVIVRDGVYDRGREGDGDVRRTDGSIACPRDPGRVRESRGAAQRGVGGCWCAWFHMGVGEKKLTADGNRDSRSGWSRRVGREPLWSSRRTRRTPPAGRSPLPSVYNATRSLFEEAGFSYSVRRKEPLRYDRHGRAGRALKGI